MKIWFVHARRCANGCPKLLFGAHFGDFLLDLSADYSPSSFLACTCRLWHQLTDLIQTFLSKQEVRATVPLVKFYDSVIADFASRANQLRLASMAVTISREIQGMFDAKSIDAPLPIITWNPKTLLKLKKAKKRNFFFFDFQKVSFSDRSRFDTDVILPEMLYRRK